MHQPTCCVEGPELLMSQGVPHLASPLEVDLCELRSRAEPLESLPNGASPSLIASVPDLSQPQCHHV